MKPRLLIVGVLALVFAIAGVAKAVSPLPMVRVLVYLVPVLSRYPGVALTVAGLIAGVETGLALALVVRRRRAPVLLALGGLLVVFTAALAALLLSRAPPGCGCFGVPRQVGGRTEAIAGMLRNLGLLCLVGWLLHMERRHGAVTVEAWPRRWGGLARRATTLIEILIALVVLAVLVALAAPAMVGARRSAHTAARLQHARDLVACLSMYGRDHRDGLPFFGTPGSALAPIRIRGFEVPGPYFREQRWFWASAIVPEYFDGPRAAIEPPGRAGYLQGVLGWPDWIVAAEFQLTSTAFALPPFWRDDPGGQPSWLDESYLRQTRLGQVRFPAQKGLVAADLAGPRGEPSDGWLVVGVADGSARVADWRQMDRARAVVRPWGAAGEPVESTRDGFEGVDF